MKTLEPAAETLRFVRGEPGSFTFDTGVLKGVQATVFPVDFAIGVLRQGGASYSQQHVVEDDNVITADGPDVAGEFARKILNRFNL